MEFYHQKLSCNQGQLEKLNFRKRPEKTEKQKPPNAWTEKRFSKNQKI